MYSRFDALDGPEEQLLHHLFAPKVVGVPRREEDDVRGDDSVLAEADGLHVGYHDVEDDGKVVEGKDEHLVEFARVPEKGIQNALFWFVLHESVSFYRDVRR
jgi:hypothetical protein